MGYLLAWVRWGQGFRAEQSEKNPTSAGRHDAYFVLGALGLLTRILPTRL